MGCLDPPTTVTKVVMSDMDVRTASVSRKTSETEIQVSIALDQPLDGSHAKISVSTGIGFLDHVSASPGAVAELQNILTASLCRCSRRSASMEVRTALT